MGDGSTSNSEWYMSAEVDCENTTTVLASGTVNYNVVNNSSSAAAPNGTICAMGATNSPSTWTNTGTPTFGIDVNWTSGNHTTGDEIYMDSLVIQRIGPG